MSDFSYNTPDYWLQEINNAEQWKREQSQEQDFEKFQKWYKHDYPNPDHPHFNLIYMLGSSLVPNIMFQRPSIIHTARRPEYNIIAGIFDGLLNFVFDEMEMELDMQNGVLAAFLQNTVAFELGYDFPEEHPIGDMTFNPIHGVSDRARKTNLPWLSAVPADQFLVASGTKNVRNCPWYARFVVLPTETLKRLAETNKEIHKNRIVATQIPKERLQSKSLSWMERQASTREYTAFWHFHEQELGQEFWLDTNGKVIMGPREDPLQVDGLPVEFLQLNDDVQSIWGTPDPHIVRSQHAEGDELRKDWRQQRRNSATKILARSGGFSPEMISKLIDSEPTPIIEIDLAGAAEKLSDVMETVDLSPKLEWENYAKFLLNDAQLLTGQGPNQQGTFASGRRTAKEVGIVDENNLLRTGFRRNKIGKVIERLGTRVDKLIAQNWTADVVVKVLGVEGTFHYVKAKPQEFAELTSEIVTKVNVESLAPVSKDRRRSEIIEVLKILPKIQGANIMPLVQKLLSTFEWAEVQGILPTANEATQDPQQFQQSQNAQLADPNLGNQAAGNLGPLAAANGATGGQ